MTEFSTDDKGLNHISSMKQGTPIYRVTKKSGHIGHNILFFSPVTGVTAL